MAKEWRRRRRAYLPWFVETLSCHGWLDQCNPHYLGGGTQEGCTIWIGHTQIWGCSQQRFSGGRIDADHFQLLMVQGKAEFSCTLLNPLKVLEDLLWASTQGLIIKIEQAQVWLQPKAELMNREAGKEGAKGVPLLYTLPWWQCLLATEECGWFTVGWVDEGGELWHEASYSIQHLVCVSSRNGG